MASLKACRTVTVALFRQTIAERGTFTFVGFAYPPRVRQALALVQSATGERGAVPIGVTRSRPALIEFFAMDDAPPTIVPRGRYSGWFDIGGRRLFLRCTGHHSPTVVFEGGLTTDWYQLQNRLSGFTRVCSYDHPNGPWSRSDLAPTPRTAATSWLTCTPCSGPPTSQDRMYLPGTPTAACSPSCMPAPTPGRWPGWS
jgi:hypothetical protein